MVANRGNRSIWKSLDWFTIAIYIVLMVFGWISVCGASYDFSDMDFFSFESRAGKQLVWMGLSLGIGFVLLMLEERIYEMFAPPVYWMFMGLLIATIFLSHDVKNLSYSNTLDIKRLAKEATTSNLRLRAPLVLYALASSKKDNGYYYYAEGNRLSFSIHRILLGFLP